MTEEELAQKWISKITEFHDRMAKLPLTAKTRVVEAVLCGHRMSDALAAEEARVLGEKLLGEDDYQP